MGVAQQLGNGQLMRTAGQTLTASIAAGGVNRFPPMPSPADQVVTLLAEACQVMADRQVAEAEQIRDRDLIRTGQAGLALPTEIVPQPFPSSLSKMSQSLVLLVREGSISV